MTRVVRPAHRVFSASCTARSDSEVERGGRFVEQDDRRILEERARDRDALALAAGKLHAALAARAVVGALEAEDELVRMRGLGGGDDFLVAGARPAHGDVLADRPLEQESLLADVGGLPAQRGSRNARRRPARR